MKRSVTLFAVVVLALALAQCRKESADNGSTETIAPAQPKPATNETDAMTQTVDIEDSRSEDDGAALTESGTSSAPPTTTTTTTAKTKTVPPKPKKH